MLCAYQCCIRIDIICRCVVLCCGFFFVFFFFLFCFVFDCGYVVVEWWISRELNIN